MSDNKSLKKYRKNDDSHIVGFHSGVQSHAMAELEEEVIQHLPKNYYQWTEEQVEIYKEYIINKMSEKEKRFIDLYDDPNSETYGNQIRSFAKAYGHEDKVKKYGTKSYRSVQDNANTAWSRRRVKKYREFMRFVEGHDLTQYIPLANKRLADIIEQTSDKYATLQAIREVHKILGTVSDGVNININKNEEAQYHFENLTDEELVTYMSLLEKLKKDPSEVQSDFEVMDNE